MVYMRYAGMVVGLGLLSACASNTEDVRNTSVTGSPFAQALAGEYRELSIFESDEMFDWIDAEYFADKSLISGQGREVLPQEVAERNLPEDAVPPIMAARTRLMAVLDGGARTTFPQAAARAQSRFDCWIEQQEENFQFDHISACRDDLMALVGSLEAEKQLAAVVVPAAEPAAQPLAPYLVFFDWDKSDITPEAWAVLQAAAGTATGEDITQIWVTGHADTSGSDAYNLALSSRRASAIEAALVQLGLQQWDYVTTFRGEREPLVLTADGVREPQNRRVEIIIGTASMPTS